MIITQEKLINELAEQEGIDVTIVRKVLKSMEKKIFAYLSSVTPTENMIIKLINGLYIEGEYVTERKMYGCRNIVCKPKIKVITRITKYYKEKVNKTKQ